MRNTVGMRDEVTEIALTAMAEKLKAEKIVCRLNKGKLFFTYHVNARHNNRSLFI